MFAEGSSVHLYRVFFYSASSRSPPTDLAADACAGLAPPRAAREPLAAAAVAVVARRAYLVAEVPHA